MPDALPPHDGAAGAVLEDLLATRDVIDGVVLDAAGKLLAGREELAPGALSLLEAAGDAIDVEVTTERRTVYASRSDSHAIALVCRRPSLPSLVAYDLHMALGRLEDAGRRAA